MYSTFLLLTLLTSLATSAPLTSDSSTIKAGGLARDLGQVDESTIITRQLLPSNTESNHRTSGDVTNQNGNPNFAVDRMTSSATEVSNTGWKWFHVNKESGAEKQARDTARVDASENTATTTSKDLQPQPRPYAKPAPGEPPELLHPGEAQSGQVPPQAEASGVPAGGQTDAAGGKGTAITDGSLNGFAFLRAVTFPHR